MSGCRVALFPSQKMDVMDTGTSGNTSPATLGTVMVSAGVQVLSYLPLGSLLNGYRSPSLVSTSFHDCVYQTLGQCKVLSLSGCKHLRKIDDETLISLIRTIVEISEAHHAEYTRKVERQRTHDCMETVKCPCPIKVRYLDLSRCRQLRGQGVHFALKHMPSLRRISLSASMRFGGTTHFVSEKIIPSCYNVLDLPKLESLDVSGCPKIDTLGARTLFACISGHQIRRLDLSGCSATVDDQIACPIASQCRNLECLGLAGMKKVTSFGVGLITYCCRETLRCLNLRGCEGIYLPEILWPTMYEMLRLADDRNRGSIGVEQLLPTNFVCDPTAETVDWSFDSYEIHFKEAVRHMVKSLQEIAAIDDLDELSQSHFDAFRSFEERISTTSSSSCERRADARLFGQLEVLDIGLIGRRTDRLEGSLAAVSWLSGGRLRQLNTSGLTKISNADVSIFILTSMSRLRVLEASSSISSSYSSADHHLLLRVFSSATALTEVDVSCCSDIVTEDTLACVGRLSNLRSLRLDHLPISDTFIRNMWRRTLLRLSIVGCTRVTTGGIHAAALEVQRLRLRELDARDIQVTMPWSKVREQLPNLLKLNNRRTTHGAAVLAKHMKIERWCNGEREPVVGKNKKRKRNVEESIESGSTGATVAGDKNEDSTESIANCCSILWTGFCKDKPSEQEMFACWTCKIDFGRFVCFACAKKCHKGHDISPIGYGAGYCDCAILSTFCDCLGEEG